MTHLIKKYSNRKLYSVVKSKHVSVPELIKMVQSGEDVTVIDNTTGKDITLKTLKMSLNKLDLNMLEVFEIINKNKKEV